MEKEVLVSIISAAGLVVAATIPSIVGAIGVKKAFNRKRLREELLQAYRDLRYMNALEEAYLEQNRECGKARLRESAAERIGYRRSRNAENARIELRIRKLEKQTGERG